MADVRSSQYEFGYHRSDPSENRFTLSIVRYFVDDLEIYEDWLVYSKKHNFTHIWKLAEGPAILIGQYSSWRKTK